MPSFFDLQKFAATGIASPEMTYFDKMRALSMAGGTVQTLTGVPPLSFKANGKPLISWSMLGNAQQTGTPSPQSIIMPTFCGVRTGNLFDKDATNTDNGYIANRYISNGGVISNSSNHNVSEYINIPNNTEYITLSETQEASYLYASFYDSEKNVLSYFSYATMPRTVSVPSDAKYIRLTIPKANSNTTMLNLGSTALPYEPYGWKISITCAGQTTPVYLGQVNTVRRVKKLVLTGEETGWTFPSAGVARLTLPSESVKTTGTDNAPISTHYIGRFSDNNGCIRVLTDAAKLNIVDTVNAVDSTTWTTYLAAQYANGTPVTIWYALATPVNAIVNEPLAKIGDYADELHSTDAGVTIPTVKGDNTLTVGTDLQPSSMTITGNIKPL